MAGRAPLSPFENPGTITTCASSLGSCLSSVIAPRPGVPWPRPSLRSSLTSRMVIGVARGGVAVAVEVGRELEAPLTAIDVERVNAYGLRLGAVTADGRPTCARGMTCRKRTSSRRSS